MMLSPGCYYEFELKGKSAEEIAKKIRSLKNEIGHLKRILESPEYGSTSYILPDEKTQLWCMRMYLDRAISAYEEAGGTYSPSRAEQRAAAFDAAVPDIVKITFSIGGYFDGYETRTVTLFDDRLHLDVNHNRLFDPTDSETEPDYSMTKEEFLDGLRSIHMGEWHRHYCDPYVLDGTQWEITIEYADGHKTEYDGSNSFPFSFDDFCRLVDYQKEDMEEICDEE